MNKNEKHKNQNFRALEFTGKAKFTSAKNLQLAAGRTRRGLPTELVKDGLLVSRDMIGLLIFGLSKKGINLVSATPFDIHKLTIGRVDHGLIAQYETLMAVKTEGVVDYEFEPQTFLQGYRPDVIWTSDTGKINVEVELSAKSIGDGEMDKFFLKILSHKTIVIFNDEVICNRYIAHTRVYLKNGIPNWKFLNGEWVKLPDRIFFNRENWDEVEFRLHKKNSNRKLSLIYDAVEVGF